MPRHRRAMRWPAVVVTAALVACGAVAAFALRSDPSPQAGQVVGFTPPPASAPATSAPVTPSHGRATVHALIIGDSYTTGFGASNPATGGYVARLKATYHWTATVVSCPGGGFVGAGTQHNGPLPRLIGQVDWAAATPDVVILQAGRNDAGYQRPQFTAGFEATIAAIRKADPTVPLVIVGLLWPAADRPAYVQVEVQNEARLAASVPNAVYVDTSRFNYPLSKDRVHPTTAGYAAITALIEKGLTGAGLVG